MASKTKGGGFRARRSHILPNYQNTLRSAFKSDVETFLQKFTEENTFNYSDFANVWQLTNFTFIYADQTNIAHLRILCEVCFNMLKKYILYQPDLHTQVGAFYLLYGLYFKQPIRKLVKIRLTLSEFRILKSLMNQMLSRGQYDVLYVFAKMKADGAFVYVAYPIPLYVSKPSDQNIDSESICKLEFKSDPSLKLKELQDDETVKSLIGTCRGYEAKLKKFAERNSGLVPFESTIIRDLEEASKAANSKAASSDAVSEKVEKSKPTSTRRSARQKAMANKNAQYRGSRQVITAIDLAEEISDSD